MGAVDDLHHFAIVLVGLAVWVLEGGVDVEGILYLLDVQVPLHKVPVGPHVGGGRVDIPFQGVKDVELSLQNELAWVVV